MSDLSVRIGRKVDLDTNNFPILAVEIDGWKIPGCHCFFFLPPNHEPSYALTTAVYGDRCQSRPLGSPGGCRPAQEGGELQVLSLLPSISLLRIAFLPLNERV